MHWNLLILLGGGVALSDVVRTSGLSDIIGQQLQHLTNLNIGSIVLIISILSAFLTEFISNMSVANIFIPILLEMVNILYIFLNFLICSIILFCI